MENENIGKIVQSSRILSFFLEMMRETLGEFISIVFICKKNDVLLLDKKKRNSCFWIEWNLSFMRLLIS